jgi:hypothetical protein
VSLDKVRKGNPDSDPHQFEKPDSYPQCCGAGMFIPDPNYFHLGSRIKGQKDSRIRFKEFKYLTQKIVCKLWEIRSKIFVPDPDLDFLPIPDPGVKKAPDPGSGSATLLF